MDIQELNQEITVTVIAAITTVIVAIITGLFVVASRMKNENTKQALIITAITTAIIFIVFLFVSVIF